MVFLLERYTTLDKDIVPDHIKNHSICVLPGFKTLHHPMPISPKRAAQDFFKFVREQGVITLAIGFLIGGAVSKLVTALITDIITPLVGLALGAAGNLKEATFMIGSATIAWGNFVSTCFDFLVIAAIVYVGIKILGIDKHSKG